MKLSSSVLSSPPPERTRDVVQAVDELAAVVAAQVLMLCVPLARLFCATLRVSHVAMFRRFEMNVDSVKRLVALARQAAGYQSMVRRGILCSPRRIC